MFFPLSYFSPPLLFIYLFSSLRGFPDSSVGKESACSARDPSSIPEVGRASGEGMGYPFQYSWASLVAQLVKNLPALRETWIRSLGWEDPLEKGKATHSSILAWRIPGTSQSMGSQRVRYLLNNFFTFQRPRRTKEQRNRDGQYSPWNSPSQNTGVCSLSLFQGIFPTQGSNPGLPHCK